MSYQRFRKPKTDFGPATLATTATEWSQTAESVADVAGVAASNLENGAESVATVATVAAALRDFANVELSPTDAEVAAAEWEERAAVLEFDEGLTRDEAERLAREQRAGADNFPAPGSSDRSEVASVDSHPRNRCAAGVCGLENDKKAQDDSHSFRPSDWLPEPSPGILILRPAIEVPPAEYDAHLDALIAALPDGSAERNRLAFAKRKGWCVDRDRERIFTRGRF